MTFEFKSASYPYGIVESLISEEQAQTVLDMLAEAGIDSVFNSATTTDAASRELRWKSVPAIVQYVENFPASWMFEVSGFQSNQRALKNLEAVRESYAAIENPAIRGELLSKLNDVRETPRGFRKAEITDCSHWARTAAVDNTRKSTDSKGRAFTVGKPAYKPEPGCKAALLVKEAVHFSYIQDSWADYSEYLVPIKIEDGADLAVCRRNLAAFARSLSTHNGMAGSGSEWTFTLEEFPAGTVVRAVARHSIAD
jgi:hypothetical protein